MMLRSYGIVVHDLGVDVSPDEVVRKAVELQPDIVGLSGLLTVATDGMKATVDAVRGGEAGSAAACRSSSAAASSTSRRAAGPAPTCGPTTPRAACGSSARRSPRPAD